MASSTGDMEFNQAMTKMPSGPKKEVAYTGTQSIIGGRFKLNRFDLQWSLI